MLVSSARRFARAWEILVAMLIMEAAFGITDVVAAPIYYAYLKDELKSHGLVWAHRQPLQRGARMPIHTRVLNQCPSIPDLQMAARNGLGGPLGECSSAPLTGFFRDGCCNTGPQDIGQHVVCAQVTQAFLDLSRAR